MNKFNQLEKHKEVKEYLDDPFPRIHQKYIYHYTSITTLAKIITTKTLLMNSFGAMNDKKEHELTEQQDETLFVSCFTKTYEDSIGMWAMYGHLNSSTCKNYVRVAFPVRELKKYIRDNGSAISARDRTSGKLFARDIAYLSNYNNIRRLTIKNNKSLENARLQHINKTELAGYIKTGIWEYENEIRLCFEPKNPKRLKNKKNKIITLPPEVIQNLIIIPSPRSTVKECRQRLKKLKVTNCIIKKNWSEGDYARHRT